MSRRNKFIVVSVFVLLVLGLGILPFMGDETVEPDDLESWHDYTRQSQGRSLGNGHSEPGHYRAGG